MRRAIIVIDPHLLGQLTNMRFDADFCHNCRPDLATELQESLKLPEGFEIVYGALDYRTGAVVVVVESDRLPETEIGNMYPQLTVTLRQEMVNDKAVVKLDKLVLFGSEVGEVVL